MLGCSSYSNSVLVRVYTASVMNCTLWQLNDGCGYSSCETMYCYYHYHYYH